jgi:hypothetical protein
MRYQKRNLKQQNICRNMKGIKKNGQEQEPLEKTILLGEQKTVPTFSLVQWVEI